MTSSDQTDYVRRFYRDQLSHNDLFRFRVAVGESDLEIGVSKKHLAVGPEGKPEIADLKNTVVEELMRLRLSLRAYIAKHPQFLTSLEPIKLRPDAPPIARDMADAARLANVGPMAAVAGAIAHAVGSLLARSFSDFIVENGGDLYLQSTTGRVIGIYAGKHSKLSDRLAIRLEADRFPVGVCTSAGTVGPSLSFGKADAVTVISRRPSLADAAATAIGNRVVSAKDIPSAIEFGSRIPGVEAIIIVKNDRLGVWGNVEFV